MPDDPTLVRLVNRRLKELRRSLDDPVEVNVGLSQKADLVGFPVGALVEFDTLLEGDEGLDVAGADPLHALAQRVVEKYVQGARDLFRDVRLDRKRILRRRSAGSVP